ncbi:MAG TPA: diguanylate cyclase [Aquabacterium sp.]|nr:diguanylate cyclase [Aquabacterium sp.]
MGELQVDSGSILIIDDDPVVVQGLGRMVSELGAVRFALSGEQGLQMAREAHPDLILLDAEMPGLSGYDVCRIIKADPDLWDIPVIFVTGHDDTDSELKALEAGAVDFIAKPPKPLLVLARVRTHLRLKQMSDELRRNANTDALTGVPNRRQFENLLDREWDRARRAGARLSLLMVDIDHFKLYNDHYGHQQGDDCLRVVAQTLQGLVQRPADTVARVGGEEFVILLPETDAAGAIHVAQRIVTGIAARHIPHDGSPASPVVTVSVGATTVRLGTDAGGVAPSFRAPELVLSADQALYAAKHAGRNCSRFLALEEPPDA